MTRPIICLSCGFPIGFLIYKFNIKTEENINFQEIEKKINIQVRTCCRMKMMSFIEDF